MGVQRNIRMRRSERVKQLTSPDIHMHAQQSQADRDHKRKNEVRSDIQHHPDLPTDPRLQDPEYVWKQKYKAGLFGDVPGEEDGPDRSWFRKFWIQFVICMVLFACVWGMFQWRHPLTENSRRFVTVALTEPLQFETVSGWFRQTFGDTPSFLPAFRSEQQQDNAIKASLGHKRTYFAPLQGIIAVPFNQNGTGILLQTRPGSSVSALDEGQVVFADNIESTGYTVFIRHPNGVQSIYGWLEQPRVKVNDWVIGGETIGYAGMNERKGTGLLYYSIKADKTYVNPADVVTFD